LPVLFETRLRAGFLFYPSFLLQRIFPLENRAKNPDKKIPRPFAGAGVFMQTG
jgi:hypothetical protein